MKFKIIFICFLLIPALTVFSQQWQQTAATPEGGGVTDLVVRQSNGNIFVSTGSYSWPSIDGGIRRSTNDGSSWDNVFDAYNGRTIIDGVDGNLYASIWPYPSNEGLYRSTDNGSTWNVLTTVPSGNNIFAIALNTKTPSVTIFAGTRLGVYRSTNNGTSWAYANNGLPTNAWVRDIEVDTTGIVAVATISGLFISADNGDSWSQATGIAAGDTIVKILFDYPLTGKKNEKRLIAGSNHGSVWQSFENSQYLVCTLMAIFDDDEASGLWWGALQGMNQKMLGVSTFPSNNQGGGFRSSSDEGATWQQNNSGLPGTNPNASALSGKVDGSGDDISVKFYLGFYDNTSVGANVYKMTYTVTGIDHVLSLIPKKYKLYQNFPNPFNPTTTITYDLPLSGHVKIDVFNLLGQKMKTLVDANKNAGKYEIQYNAENLASGVYYYRLQAGEFRQLKKMILLQ